MGPGSCAAVCPPQQLTSSRPCSTSKIPHGGFVKPDTVSYELVALAHFRAGLASTGLEVLDACALHFQPPTSAGYAQCMAAAASTGGDDGVAALWRHMAALGAQ